MASNVNTVFEILLEFLFDFRLILAYIRTRLAKWSGGMALFYVICSESRN
jgi:hypothetical protein